MEDDDGLLGYKIREKLFPTEDEFFRANPKTTGVASETGEIVLNPYADPSVNREAVAKNEAFRLYLRDRKISVPFSVTTEQKKSFAGTPYEHNEASLKETIAARIYSGDPSARATPEQKDWVKNLFRRTIIEGDIE